MPVLQTFISPVRSRTPVEGARRSAKNLPLVLLNYQQQNLSCDNYVNNKEEVYWFDELLNGGLMIPQGAWDQAEGESAFVLLLTGPPGTGKTTFATQLCYNLATHDQRIGGQPWRSLYVSAETPAKRFIENAESFGWKSKFFQTYDDTPLIPACCTVYGAERLKLLDDKIDYEEFFESLVQVWLCKVGDDDWNVVPSVAQSEQDHNGEHPHEALPPDVVVIDSLNVLHPDAHTPGTALGKTYRNLLRWIGKGKKSPRLLVVILDGFQEKGIHHSWKFLADAVIRFDATDDDVGLHGYYSRSLQIMKVKTQSHAWGKHSLKIYAGPVGRERHARDRIPPYLEVGGAFVFPSVHWHLSKSRRFQLETFNRGDFYQTGIERLDEVLGDFPTAGFPALKTTAFTGRRGAMKSHLAYYSMLGHALGTIPRDPEPKNVLLISLRDDLSAAKETLSKIVEQQQLSKENTGTKTVQKLIDEDRLEILYNPPGCISPGELLHRIFVALRRQRDATTICWSDGSELPPPERPTAEIVVLNGLDHLDAKFPLCAREAVFIPALTTLFRNHEVCSIVVSAELDTRHQLAHIGAMADLILEFSDVGTGG